MAVAKKIIFGDNLVVTDQSNGVIRVDGVVSSGSGFTIVRRTITAAEIAAVWDEDSFAILPLFELVEDDAFTHMSAWHTIADAGKIPEIDLYLTDESPAYEELLALQSFPGNLALPNNYVRRPSTLHYDLDSPPLVDAERKWLTLYATTADTVPPETGTVTIACGVLRNNA